MKNQILIITLLLSSLTAFSQNPAQPQLVFEEVASGVSGLTDIAHSYDSRLFLVEQVGRIRIMYSDYTIDPTPFIDIRSDVKSNRSEQGLLGMAFHPDFSNNGTFFLSYTNNSGTSVVSRFKVDLNNVNIGDPSTEEVILTVGQPFDNHNGGDMAFGPDGYLYIGLGDGGSGGDPGDRSQNPQNLLGKMLRIDIDSTTTYRVPADNPFVNDPNIADEIWSIGLRNPWRFSFDRQTGDMWVADVGQGRFEEVNFEPANTPGLNYGWRCYEGPNTFNLSDCDGPSAYIDPVFSYDHLSLLGGSITGGFVYRGNDYPNLQGHYVVGDYESGNVWSLYPDGMGQFTSTFWGQRFGRNQLATFGENFAGELFAGTHDEGKIYRVVDTSSVATNITDRINNRLRIYHQTGSDKLSLWLEQETLESPSLILYALNGKQVQVPTLISRNRVELSLDGLPKGLYVVRLKTNGQEYVKKFQIK